MTAATANAQRNEVRTLLPDRELSEVEVRKFYRDLFPDPNLTS